MNDMKKVRYIDVKLADRAVRSRARKQAARTNYLQFIKKSAQSSTE